MTRAKQLLDASVTPGTARTYLTGVNRLVAWLTTVCATLGIAPPPLGSAADLRLVLAEPSLIGGFLASLSIEEIAASTASTYLDGIIHYATDLGGHPGPRDYVVSAILRGMRGSQPPRPEQPVIQAGAMHAMVQAVPSMALAPVDAAAFVAAMLMGYYGAMRVSEYLVSGDPGKLLTRGDVTFAPAGASMTIRLKKTKNNQVGPAQLVTIPASHMGAAADAVCPVASVLRYVAVRDARFGADPTKPFFSRSSGAALTPRVFNAWLKRAGDTAGIVNWRDLGSHAFKAGSTTDMVINGADFLTVKAHGRWASDKAPASYIRKAAMTVAAKRGQAFLGAPQQRQKTSEGSVT